MEVLQTLGYPMQLSPGFSNGNDGKGAVTYKLQPVGMILSDVFHDIPVRHPLRHSDELSFPHVPVNSSQTHDVRMGQHTPEDDLLAKLLE